MQIRISPIAASVLVLSLTLFTLPAFAQRSVSPIYEEVRNAEELRAALDRIPTGDTSGGTIVLRPGTYRLIRPIVIRRNHYVNIKGSGWNTLIRIRGDHGAFIFEDCWYCTVEDVWIRQDGDWSSGSALVFKGSSACSVRECRLEGFGESGVRFLGTSERPTSSNEVHSCLFLNNRGDQIYSYYHNDFHILGNQFGTASSRSGCALEYSSAGTYSMNHHWDNDVALRMGPGANFNRVENNRFEESRQSGILIGTERPAKPSCLNIILGNTIHTNSKNNSERYSAVTAFDAQDTIFSDNQVFSWNSKATRHKHALELRRGCLRWNIRGNTLRHHAKEPIFMEGDQQNLINDNIVLEN